VVLLVEGATADGLVPALCEVKVVLSDQEPHLSTALWEDDKYRYIFCFDTEELDLTWVELRDQLRFASRYNPGGQFMPVKAERLQSFNGAERYVEWLRYRYGISHSPVDESPDTTFTRLVGARSTQQIDQIARELEHVRDTSIRSEPVLTEGRPRAQYTRSAIPRDDAFRVGVAEIYGSECAVCGRGVRGPDGRREVQSAHIRAGVGARTRGGHEERATTIDKLPKLRNE
jgi:hypothetical protein